jgi:hypothetical protein
MVHEIEIMPGSFGVQLPPARVEVGKAPCFRQEEISALEEGVPDGTTTTYKSYTANKEQVIAYQRLGTTLFRGTTRTASRIADKSQPTPNNPRRHVTRLLCNFHLPLDLRPLTSTPPQPIDRPIEPEELTIPHDTKDR